MGVPVGEIGLDRRTCRRIDRKVATVDAVHRLEVPGVPQKHVDRDDVSKAEPARRQLFSERVKRGRGLLFDGRERRAVAGGAGDVRQEHEFGRLGRGGGEEQKGQDGGREGETDGGARRDAHCGSPVEVILGQARAGTGQYD